MRQGVACFLLFIPAEVGTAGRTLKHTFFSQPKFFSLLMVSGHYFHYVYSELR